jgi:hypothetical protein
MATSFQVGICLAALQDALTASRRRAPAETGVCFGPRLTPPQQSAREKGGLAEGVTRLFIVAKWPITLRHSALRALACGKAESGNPANWLPQLFLITLRMGLILGRVRWRDGIFLCGSQIGAGSCSVCCCCGLLSPAPAPDSRTRRPRWFPDAGGCASRAGASLRVSAGCRNQCCDHHNCPG